MAYPSCSFSRNVGLLSWKFRVQIALDVAEYVLHNDDSPNLAHNLDVKCSNILLDGSFHAKEAIASNAAEQILLSLQTLSTF